jgi:hypothetical protein
MYTLIQLFSQKKPKVVQRWVDFILFTYVKVNTWRIDKHLRF